MTELSIHADNIDGHKIDIVLNAPYRTLVAASRRAKGTALRKFCEEQTSEFAKVVGEQAWVSPFRGILFCALVDDHLDHLGIDTAGHIVLVPLDYGVYSVEVGPFGTCAQGTESILGLNNVQASTEHIVIGCGSQADRFDNVIEVDIVAIQRKYELLPLWMELLKHRYFTGKHYAACIGSAGLIAAVVLFAGTHTGNKDGMNESTSTETFKETLPPKGSDFGLRQILFLDQIMRNEIGYLLGKGLHSIHYDVPTGVTISGDYPPLTDLTHFILETERAGLAMELTGDGWRITKQPVISPQQYFDLPDITLAYVAVQQLKQWHGYDMTMYATTIGNQQQLTVRLDKSITAPAFLGRLALVLKGLSVELQSFNVVVKNRRFESMSMVVNINGTRS